MRAHGSSPSSTGRPEPFTGCSRANTPAQHGAARRRRTCEACTRGSASTSTATPGPPTAVLAAYDEPRGSRGSRSTRRRGRCSPSAATACATPARVRSALDGTGLRLLLHAPDDLSAGDARARPRVRRPARLRRRGGRRARRLPRTQLRGSRRPCGRAPPRARPARGAVPHPAPPAGAFPWRHRRDREPRAGVSPHPPARRSHDPLAVRDLVRRLDQPAAGMLLDLGHLHITADATRSDHAALLAACAPDVVLFHVHDNLGCRRRIDAPGVDPVKLDLHLPPGRGSLPWARIAGHGRRARRAGHARGRALAPSRARGRSPRTRRGCCRSTAPPPRPPDAPPGDAGRGRPCAKMAG